MILVHCWAMRIRTITHPPQILFPMLRSVLTVPHDRWVIETTGSAATRNSLIVIKSMCSLYLHPHIHTQTWDILRLWKIHYIHTIAWPSGTTSVLDWFLFSLSLLYQHITKTWNHLDESGHVELSAQLRRNTMKYMQYVFEQMHWDLRVD